MAAGLRRAAMWMVLLRAGCAWSQPAAGQLVESTVGVISYDADKRDNDKAQTFSVGILIDETHVITSLHSCCRKREGVQRLGFAAVVSKESAVPAEVIWSSAEKDVVILQLAKPVAKKPASLYPSNLLREGDRLFVLHYTGVEGNEFKTEVVSATAGPVTNWQTSKAIKTDLAPYQNNDGAPVFNACGAVVAFRVNSTEPGGLAILASEMQAAAEAAKVKIVVESEACKQSFQGGSPSPTPATAPPTLSPKDARRDKPLEEQKSPLDTRTWVAIVAGVVVLVLVLIRQRTPAAARQTKGPVLTSNLPPLPGGRPYFPPATPQYVGTPHAFLAGVSGEYLGLRLDLGARPIVIGRDPKSANLVLINETVSNLHCAVSYDPPRGVFVLQDLGSANGTHLSTGQRIAPNSLLDIAPGTQFSVGDLSNRFQVTTEYPQ